MISLTNLNPALNRYQRLLFIIGIASLAFSMWGAFNNSLQFWQSYLLAYIFWLEAGLGCLGLAMLHHLAAGRWSQMTRRVMEAGGLTLPLMALLFLPLLLGLNVLYPWTIAENVAQSPLLQQKVGWLNVPFFLGRSALYLLIWMGLAYFLSCWSWAQDRAGDQRNQPKLYRLSAVGMILYILSATFAGYDWLMSLEPEWFSSIYGLILIAGQGLAGLTLAIMALGFWAKSQPDEAKWQQPFADMGNLLLGFVLIWVYFSFSQFLVIWSTDIPEEAIWYINRSRGGWENVAIFLVVIHFILPCLLLLSRGIKQQVHSLMIVAFIVFLVRLLDLSWLIIPAFHPRAFHLHWLDFTLFLAIGSAWVLLFIRLWLRAPSVQLVEFEIEESYEQYEELTTA